MLNQWPELCKRERPPRIITINRKPRIITINRNVSQLLRSQTPWITGKNFNKSENYKTEEVFKKFKGLRNKISDKNFDKISSKILQLEINSEERMQGIVNMLFNEALREPGFCGIYAQLVKRIGHIGLSDGDRSSFRKRFVAKCKKHFKEMKDKDSQLKKIYADFQALDLHLGPDSQVSDWYDTKGRVKEPCIGLMRMIGELHNLQIINLPDIGQILAILLTEVNDLKAEQTCELVKTVHNKKIFIQYKNQFLQLSSPLSKLSSRVRFGLSDLIEKLLGGRGTSGGSAHGKASAPVQNAPIIAPEATKVFQTKSPPITVNDCRPALSQELLKRKTKSLLGEYLLEQNTKEAIQCVKEIEQSSIDLVVKMVIEDALAKSSEIRSLLGELLFQLIDQQVVTLDQFQHALEDILELGDEMSIDIPRFWTYMGELLGPLLKHDKNGISEAMQKAMHVIIPTKRDTLLQLVHLNAPKRVETDHSKKPSDHSKKPQGKGRGRGRGRGRALDQPNEAQPCLNIISQPDQTPKVSAISSKPTPQVSAISNKPTPKVSAISNKPPGRGRGRGRGFGLAPPPRRPGQKNNSDISM